MNLNIVSESTKEIKSPFVQWKKNCQYLLSGFGMGVVLNRLGDSLFILEILEDATFQKTMGEKEEGKEDEENIIQMKLLLLD